MIYIYTFRRQSYTKISTCLHFLVKILPFFRVFCYLYAQKGAKLGDFLKIGAEF